MQKPNKFDYPKQLTWKNLTIATLWSLPLFLLIQVPMFLQAKQCIDSGAAGCELTVNLGLAFLGMAGIPIALLVMRKKNNWSWADLGLSRPKVTKREALRLLGLGILLIIALDIIMNLFALRFPVAGEEQFSFGKEYFLQNILVLSLFAIGLAPFVEELLYRGLLLSSIGRRYGFMAGAILGSIIFGLSHGQIAAASVTFIMGMYLSWMYRKTNSLWLGIILHLLNNSVAVMALYLAGPR